MLSRSWESWANNEVICGFGMNGFSGVVEADEGVEIVPIDKKFKVFCVKGSSKVEKVEDNMA